MAPQLLTSRLAFLQQPRRLENSAIQNRVQHAHWSTYSFVQLILKNLPEGTTTLSVYNYFRRYGNIAKIIIFDRRQDDRGTHAQITFEPPPEIPFWTHSPVKFTTDATDTRLVYVELANYQPRNFQIESPVHRGVMYTEKTELHAHALTFGVLDKAETMMTVKTAEAATEKVKFILNLRKREIQVRFPFTFHSENRSAVRSYRFAIAIDETVTIWRLSGHRYVFHLPSIPWYSKQLKEAIAQTHTQDAKQWSEEDTWARQTDIFEHKSYYEMINSSPISLQKNFNTINIARWTTFLATMLETEANAHAEQTFCNALKDFNVRILDGTNFRIIEAGPHIDRQAWSILDGGLQDASLSNSASMTEKSHVHLPFLIRYHLEVCISHGWISEYQITTDFLKRLSTLPEDDARQSLIHTDSYRQRVWDPIDIMENLKYQRPVKRRVLPEHCVEVYSATVTATSIIWNTPTVEMTNRVVRKYQHYADRFLRVRFEDDTYRGQSRIHASSNNRMIMVLQRVRRALKNGINLGNRHYEFLAWGNSQLREHGAYFFARVGDLTAAKIRAEMGAFDNEKVVAKRAARMGQCFSTTRAIQLRLPAVTNATTILDIKQGKHIFSDGVGKISRTAAELVSEQLKIRGPTPSAYQFRLGGCKGVLVVWNDLEGVDVQVRQSQFKFDSRSGDLEIIRWSEFWQPFLNRQIILCLSDLGVPDTVFLARQEEAIRALDAAMTDDAAASKALRDNVDPNMMTMALVETVEAGFRASHEPFITSLLHLWRAWSLKYLKEKAKIPVTKGAFVLGCVDETRTLKGHLNKPYSTNPATDINYVVGLPEIFIQITDPHTGNRKVIEGICVLARNPSLHRGDIRVVNAVNNTALNHLCDVVVMPAKGDRDLPSMCSGGDLDGDDYMVIWDDDLIPADWNAEPFHYDPPPPRTAVGDITTNDIINFFYDYLRNDFLGRIAHAHLGAADFLNDGIRSHTCLELVKLHSMAVDYPKTGIPAVLPRRLERVQWPHFMEKPGKSYRSHKILGKLYDAVERVSFTPYLLQKSPSGRRNATEFDSRILNAGPPASPAIFSAIADLKQDYDEALQRIMAQHDISTEFEVWSTFVLGHSKASRDFKFHEEIGRLSSGLKETYFEALCELAGGRNYEKLAPIAVAAYQYTNAVVMTAMEETDQGLRTQNSSESQENMYSGNLPFISFPWILKDVLCQVAKNVDKGIPLTGPPTPVGTINATTKTSEEVDEAGNADTDEHVNTNTKRGELNTKVPALSPQGQSPNSPQLPLLVFDDDDINDEDNDHRYDNAASNNTETTISDPDPPNPQTPVLESTRAKDLDGLEILNDNDVPPPPLIDLDQAEAEADPTPKTTKPEFSALTMSTDPFHMTEEQMKQMGLLEDMEL